ncbi:HAD domain-containing protein [Streptomyces sp. NPDC012637]|uniref:HAD domain-containing protein n=1 Tax=Streptomyces sp. NPDC012637 TaxID=3364842 RepID=UPI0036F00451
MRFLIFLDVDGPLIPFGGPGPHPAHAPEPPPDAHPLLHRVDPAHGLRVTSLAAFGGELVWATTWGADANEVLAPRLGLPPLPVVSWPDDDEAGAGAGADVGARVGADADVDGDVDGDVDAVAGLHWKTRALAAWAAGRPYVWLDDEITSADRTWARAHHPAPALLRRVDPRTGLTEADYRAVEAWARADRRGAS